MDQKLLDKLNKRKEEGTFRSLSSFSGIDFYSNDYLGLSKVATHFKGQKYGSTGSRLISGNSKEAMSCEEFLAHFFKIKAALIFNSGYDANVGLFSSVPQKGDLVLFDEMIHASVRDGLRLSFADAYSFGHNNLEDLEKKLLKAKGKTIYVAVESLYSMDGDCAPLKEILNLTKKYNTYLIVDEAHACGVFGEKGRGLVHELGIENDVFARVVTFGKAYGSHGACVLGSAKLKDYLINFARSFIYTTALDPAAYERIENIVAQPSIDEERKKLFANIDFFRKKITSIPLISDERSPIQMLRIGDVKESIRLAQLLQSEGFAVKPIFSPTVKKGDEGIRICLHSFNTSNEIEKICNLMHL